MNLKTQMIPFCVYEACVKDIGRLPPSLWRTVCRSGQDVYETDILRSASEEGPAGDTVGEAVLTMSRESHWSK